MSRSNDTAPEVLRLRQHMRSAGLNRRAELVAIAKQAGVDPRMAQSVAAGRPVNAEGYLALCAVVGLDPRDLTPRKPRVPSSFDWPMLGMFAHAKRFQGPIITEVRPAAAAIGISPATLSRLEHGNAVNVANLLAVCRHYGFHPDQFVKPVSVDVSRVTVAETATGEAA